MIEKELAVFFKSLRIYLTKDMLKILIFPLIGSIIMFYGLFFTMADNFIEFLDHSQIQIEQHQTNIQNGISDTISTEQTVTGSSVLDFLLQYTITSWIIGIFIYGIGVVAMGYLSIFFSLIIVGFFTSKILALIHKKHYLHLRLEKPYGNSFNSLFALVKHFIIMVILFIVLIPFYFIPVLNMIALFIPFYYFFHSMLNFDVSSNLFSNEQMQSFYPKIKTNIRIKTLILYICSLIPFVAFFIATFYIIYLGVSYYEFLHDQEMLKVE